MRILPIMLASVILATSLAAQPPTLSDLGAGKVTSEAATRFYLDRIARLDKAGPKINAVIALNPAALRDAKARDKERRNGQIRSPLHGVPILIKDNIESADRMPTTAGSLALAKNFTGRDAPLVARLRAAGAVILGKTNLSEWANIRSTRSTSGWSAVGGQTRNPHGPKYPDDARNPCGSSAGSGAAMAMGFAAATIGTETDGSIVCPASINGIVGMKPTVGLVSGRFIVPISHSQDTAGPMTASVRDAAVMLTWMAGGDPGDPAAVEADKMLADYAVGLTPDGLKGLRIGMVEMTGASQPLLAAAKARLETAGAIVVPITIAPADYAELGEAEFKVLLTELKADIATYLQGLPKGNTPHRTLADLIAFNKANATTELAHFGQEIFEMAEKEGGLDSPAYLAARAKAKRLATVDGIDNILAANRIDLIVGQTNGPAWLTTLGKGDKFNPPSMSRLPAVAGYPHLTVPMGAVDGLPVGLSFIGPRWADALVLRAGHAFEVAGPGLRVVPKK